MCDDRFAGLVEALVSYQSPGVFNQYRDVHPAHDLGGAAAIRVRNLCAYLAEFAEAGFVLLAEAAGYQGCRFSGIPMTSESQIAGSQALHWAKDDVYLRSGTRSTLWREPSATILWEALGRRMDCLIWNTVPWHPVGNRGPLSNRTPRRSEILAGLEVFQLLIEQFPAAKPVAIGRVAESALDSLGIESLYVRHPSHGGKPQFTAGIQALSRMQ